MVLANGVVALRRRQEIRRYQLCALVYELVKRMLPVGPRLTPDDWSGLVRNRPAAAVNRFSVALHVALLEIGGEAVHVLVIGKYCLGFSAEEIGVPDAQQRKHYRDVLSRTGRF